MALPRARGREQLFKSFKQPSTRLNLGALPLVKLRRLVMPWLRSGQYAVLLDHVGPVCGAYAAFLEEVAGSLGVPIVVAVRSLDRSESGWIWWVGWSFAKIEVPVLRSSEARQLIEKTLDGDRVSLPDRDEFTKGVIRLARGNPAVIIRICRMARSPRYQVGGRTDLRLLLLDGKLLDLQDRIDAESRIPLRGPVPVIVKGQGAGSCRSVFDREAGGVHPSRATKEGP